MLRVCWGLAAGNGFDIGGCGTDSNGCATLETISSDATARISPLSGRAVVGTEEEAGGGGCAKGENGGVVDEGLSWSGMDDVKSVSRCGGGRDSGEGGGRTKEVGRSDAAGTVEGFTSVSKDASTRLPVGPDVGRLGRELDAVRFADAEGLLVAFRGDLNIGFALDFERVFRGETRRRDGPGCGAASGGAAVRCISGFVETNKSRFLGGLCSTRFWFEKEYKQMVRGEGEREKNDVPQAQSWPLGCVEVPELGRPPTRHLGEGMRLACPVLQGYLVVDSRVLTFSRP